MTESPRLRGLLVDWGGVMTSNVFDAFRRFCAAEGLSADTIAQRFRSDPASRELLVGLENGTLPEEAFEQQLGEQLGVAPEGLIARLFAGGRPDEAMQAAVRRARQAGVQTGLISNSWGTSRYDRALLDELFCGIVISGEVGIRKPATEIYELGARAVGLPPQQCVFVDDLSFNLTPAQGLGMATVHHVDSSTTIGELERLLSVALR